MPLGKSFFTGLISPSHNLQWRSVVIIRLYFHISSDGCNSNKCAQALAIDTPSTSPSVCEITNSISSP